MSEDLAAPAEEAQRLEHFAASVAHDFNNLLTGILGNLELMRNRVQKSGVTQYDGYLDGARHAGSRAALFAQRLLAFSGRTCGEPEPVEVAQLLAETAASMQGLGHPITVDCQAADSIINCDPSQAELALQELLTNAAEAAPLEAIVLAASLQAGALTITVRDTGSGMPEDILARAAEPFFTTRPNGAGKGLGLAIVHRFVRQAGGRLELDSIPGQGTTAKIILPHG